MLWASGDNDMWSMGWTKLIAPFVSLMRPLRQRVARLRGERQAGNRLFESPQSKLIDEELDKTLARLRGEEAENSWLSQILTSIEHRLITPEFLREQGVRDWLAKDQVRCDLKALASARFLGAVEDDGVVRRRLIEAYSIVANKERAFAVEAINSIVAILVAGYKDSFEGSSISLPGLIQAGFTENREGLEKVGREMSGVNEKLDSLGPDILVVIAHTEQATRNLSRILKRRGFLADRAREEICVLVHRVLAGELCRADHAIKTKALCWAARLHASDARHILLAKSYLDQLRKLDPGYDTQIVNALIMEQEGNVEGALRLLRDIDSPDGHSTLLTVLSRTRGKEEAASWLVSQPNHKEPRFLTGMGWTNLAVLLAEMGMWERASDYLADAHEHLEDWPDLAYVEGVINGAMLLPTELRYLALRMELFHPQIQTVKGPSIDRRRVRAYNCFNQAERLMTEIGEARRAQAAKAWLLWLRLTDEKEEIAETARGEVREAMKDPARAVDFLAVALAFRVDFDKGPLQRYLMQRTKMGGLEGQDVVAEVLLAETTMTASEYANFLEREECRLAIEVSIATLAGKRIEALLLDGQIARSKHVLEKHKSDFAENDYDRLRAMILKKEGGDPRATFEEIYLRTGLLFDLRNLIQEIGQVQDWVALRPLLEKLFQLEPTRDNASRLVDCMQRDSKSGYVSIVTFFQENPGVSDWSEDLKSANAWALFYVGRSREARVINDQLLNARSNPTDLQLDINLAIQSGNWERFSAIIDREWDKRDACDANLLLRLALLAAEADPITSSRAIELAKLAANKAPNDPSVLMNAYSLTVQLGRDHEADPSWMARAAELSSDSGPVHQVDMRTLVQEMMPAHRERDRLIERNLLQGKVPLHMAATALHMPLSRILIDLPRRNAEQGDGRRRVIIPIVSGARQIIGLQSSWVVGIDITSLMVLGFLGLLRDVMNAFNRIVLAPETMVVLLDERRRVRFHQPSRIKNAEEIRELIEKDQLKPVKLSTEPPLWLVEEVGRDLAEMLETARVNNGRVVRPRPIYQLRTFLEKEADLKEYDKLILSTTDLGRLLVEAGKLSREKYEQARNYLVTQDKGQEEDRLAAAFIFGAPLHLDDLAVIYLQQSGLLESVCRCGLDLRVHPSMREEQLTLVVANREGERLNEKIDDIRSALREALENGKAVFSPRHDVDDEMIGSLSGFIADTGACDIVCIDDRYLNRNGFLADKKGRNVPITCTLDLISYLETQGLIDVAKKRAVLHRLREAAFALVPVDPDELEQLLRAALFDQDNQLIESPELRAIRQLLMRIRSSDMIQHPVEAPYLARLRLACILTIRRLWQDDNVPIDQAVVLVSWVWANVAPSPIDWERTAHDSIPVREKYVRHLTSLFSPMGRLRPARYTAFLQWIECAVLGPLSSANDSLIDDLAKQLKIEIGQLVERLRDGNRQGSDR